jgi:hypothetical protein
MALVKTTQKSMDYIPAKRPSLPTKQGIQIIGEMSTPRILWFVTAKHSRGLKTLAIIGLLGYIVYDKLKFVI